MSGESSHRDPFRCYVGRTVVLDGRAYRVAGHELDGRELLFRLQDPATGDSATVTVLDLLGLEQH